MRTGFQGDFISRPSQTAVLVLSAPGRRRDTFLALLRTILDVSEFICPDSLGEARDLVSAKSPPLVVIDHTVGSDLQRDAMQEIRRLDARVWILLLIARPHDAYTFDDPRPDSILCDGFSITSLIDEIHRIEASRALEPVDPEGN